MNFFEIKYISLLLYSMIMTLTNSLKYFHIKSKFNINQIACFCEWQRLDRIVSNRGVGSRSEVSKLLKQGKVKVNGKVQKSSSTKFSKDVIVEIEGSIITEVLDIICA
jgi:RNA-binding protein YlmH